jgi:nucleoside-triphosphatase
VKPPPSVLIVTGAKGAGKTRWCEQLATYTRNAGYTVAGLLSPGQFAGGAKTGIIALDLQSGEERTLAVRNPDDGGRRWQFNEETLIWGNQKLSDTRPCHTLIIDEIGPLELQEERGWTAVWTLLAAGHFRRAFLVIRPSLLTVARQRLQRINHKSAPIYEVPNTKGHDEISP